MVIVHNADHHKYIDKQRKVDLIKYSKGFNNLYNGSAIYLPRRIYEGENVFTDIFNLF